MKKELTLEETFAKLEELISTLESPEITLEESFQNYKAGMELIRHCNDKIDKVEKQVKILSENGELHEFS